jgi:hypothetical protein
MITLYEESGMGIFDKVTEKIQQTKSGYPQYMIDR